MTLDFFLEHYDMSEYSIEAIVIKDNKLYIDCIMPIYLELIANGYRPEMNMTQEKTFILYVNHEDKEYLPPYQISMDMKIVQVNNELIEIEKSTVDVK